MRNSATPYAAHWIKPYNFGFLQVIETAGKEHEMITKLIAQLALKGSFNLIAGDEWLPDRDTLYRSVRRYTLRLDETLEHPSSKRPKTCLQLLDLLMEADMQNRPTLITNFLHHFYNADVDLSLRDRILERCCQYIKTLSQSNSVVVLVPHLSIEEYTRFLSVLAKVADEIIPVAEWFEVEASQELLF